MLTRSWTVAVLAGAMIVASSNGLAAQESEPPRVRALAEVSGLRAMPLGEFRDRIGDGPAHLNLAARYQNNGRVEYLREGDITDLPGGALLLNRQRSRADLVSVQFGASVGLRRPGSSQAREQ